MKPSFFFSKRMLFGLVGSLALTLALWSSYWTAHSQNPTQPTYNGKTRTVNVVPFTNTHAGVFTFITDSDNDGMSDSCETVNGFNPNDPTDADLDADSDGLTNGDECALGTNPRVADTDGDGFNDGIEVQQGYNPLDPNSHPPVGGVTLVSLSVTPSVIGLTINSIIPQNPVPLTVTGTFSDNSTVNLTNNPATSYQSGNSGIAAVDSFGAVAAVGAGTTTITVRNGTVTTTALVTVTGFTPGPVAAVPLPGFANNVDVSGNFAFVACGIAGLQVVDVADPAQARIVGSVALPGNANDVRVVGNLAYLACGIGGLQVVDVSQPTAPHVLGGITFSEAVDVVVRGTTAYVAAGAGGLKVVDVISPTVPQVTGSFTLPAGMFAHGVDVDNRGIAVVAATGPIGSPGLQLVDVSNPATPVARGGLPLSAVDVRIVGTRAYVCADGVQVVDLANPDTPQLVGSQSAFPVPSDIEVRNGLAVASLSAGQATSVAPFFSLNNPTALPYLGVLTFPGPYISGKGVALNDRLVLLTAGRDGSPADGASGDTVLLIGQYAQTDTSGTPPLVTITGPGEGATLVAGESLPISVSATDDVAVASVQVKVDGTTIGTTAQPPYRVPYTVRSTPGPIQFDALALDGAGNQGNATPVHGSVVASDPLTTVIGVAVDRDGMPVVGAVAMLENTGLTTTTDSQGQFTFGNVSTLPYGITAAVRVTDGGGDRIGRSAVVTRVRGGTTNVGTVQLTGTALTTLPAPFSGFGLGRFNLDAVDDFFLGFSDQPSQIYLATTNGQFTPNPAAGLPVTTVRSGTVVNADAAFPDVLAQPVGQADQVTLALFNGGGTVAASQTLASGLAGECDDLAAGEDYPNTQNRRPVLAFLRVLGGMTALGTSLTVRVGDGAGNFGAPLQLPVDGSDSLRGLRVVDVTGDNLVDVVVLRQVTVTQAELLVFPRTGDTTFGTVVRSPIEVRDVQPTFATTDYAFGPFFTSRDLAVLGNDRIRLYRNNGAGAFVAEQEIALPAGLQPLGIGTYGDASGTYLGVVAKETAAPLTRLVLVYGNGLGEPKGYPFTATVDETDVRVVFGDFDNNPMAADLAVVDGNSIRTFLNLGGNRPQNRTAAPDWLPRSSTLGRFLCRVPVRGMKF